MRAPSSSPSISSDEKRDASSPSSWEAAMAVPPQTISKPIAIRAISDLKYLLDILSPPLQWKLQSALQQFFRKPRDSSGLSTPLPSTGPLEPTVL